MNNIIRILNRNFDFHKMVKNNWNKYINLKYGKFNFRTLLCLPWKKLLGFKETHHCNAYLKSTFEKVWTKEYDILDETSRYKLRSPYTVNQYIFKYWQFCEGEFVPQSNIRKAYRIFDDLEGTCEAIKKQKYKLICLNDSDNGDFEQAKNEIINAFNEVLAEKSSFEK